MTIYLTTEFYYNLLPALVLNAIKKKLSSLCLISRKFRFVSIYTKFRSEQLRCFGVMWLQTSYNPSKRLRNNISLMYDVCFLFIMNDITFYFLYPSPLNRYFKIGRRKEVVWKGTPVEVEVERDGWIA